MGWQLAVSFAVALSADAADHPQRGEPWHALESFDALGGHLRELGGAADATLIEAMITTLVGVLRAHHLLRP